MLPQALHRLTTVSPPLLQKFAVDDLLRVVQSLNAEGLAVFLGCLYDTDQQQKAYARKESVRLFGKVAELHGDLVAPHLQRVVANLVRRFRDQDSTVREACADAMGLLAAHVNPAAAGPSSGSPMPSAFTGMGVFFKPLFDAMGEQNKNVQFTGSLCLAKVIECSRAPLASAVPRICPRMAKYIANPSFLGKAAMLQALANLSMVSGDFMTAQLPSVIPAVVDALASDDWMTRKAAAEALTQLLGSQDKEALKDYKEAVLTQLEACRFDKVKPVRASVAETYQAWKDLPGPVRPVPAALSERRRTLGSASLHATRHSGSSTPKSSKPAEEVTTPDPPSKSTPPTRTPLLKGAAQRRALAAKAQSPTTPAETPGKKEKKRLTLSELRQMNPTFFSPTQAPSQDWTIEVAIPRNPPPPVQDTDPPKPLPKPNPTLTEPLPEPYDEEQAAKDFEALKLSTDVPWGASPMSTPVRRVAKPTENKSLESLAWESLRPSPVNHNREEEQGGLPWGAVEQEGGVEGEVEEVKEQERGVKEELREQLDRLEKQQMRLEEMLQDFISGNQTIRDNVELRLQALERTVGALIHPPPSSSAPLQTPPSSSTPPEEHPPEEAPPDKAPASYNLASPGSRYPAESHLPPVPLGRPEWLPEAAPPVASRWAPPGRPFPELLDSESPGVHRRLPPGRGDRLRASGSWELNDGVYSTPPLRGGPRGGALVSSQESLESPSGVSRQSPSSARRSLESLSWGGGIEESPPRRVSVGGVVRTPPGYGSGDDKVRGARAWSSALERLRQGRVEEAYMEVLALGDELQLVRLVGRTGPVLSHLTPETTAEAVSALVALLNQESFFDIILPCFHQLAELRRDLLPRSLQRAVVDSLLTCAQQPTLAGSESAQLVSRLCEHWASTMDSLL